MRCAAAAVGGIADFDEIMQDVHKAGYGYDAKYAER